jgi:2-iminobutanoate/2-iminopropanoate deaminase
MPKLHINPLTLFDSKQYGFSQLVVNQSGGRTFYTSGQVAVNKDQDVIGSNLFEQTRQAIINLKLALEAAGGDLSDIMSLRIYFVHAAHSDVSSIGDVLREFFGTETPPAATWIGVTSLARKKFLIEIEAMGMIDRQH